MCIIVYKPNDKVINRRTLKSCYESNPDGCGFMYSSNNELKISKGYFGFRSFYRAFRKAERANPESDFVMHFRIATSGKTDIINCHPFWVNKGLGFAHNGVLSKLGNTVFSDTHCFTYEVLSKLPNKFLTITSISELLEDYAVASGSKFAFMDNKGDVTIFNSKAGVWEKGIWFSNSSYSYSRYLYASSTNNYIKAYSDYGNSMTNAHHHSNLNTNHDRDIASSESYLYDKWDGYCPLCASWYNTEEVVNNTCPCCGCDIDDRDVYHGSKDVDSIMENFRT